MGQRCFPEEGTGKARVIGRLSRIFLVLPSLVLPSLPAAHSGLWLPCRDRIQESTPAAAFYWCVSYTLHSSNPTGAHFHMRKVLNCSLSVYRSEIRKQRKKSQSSHASLNGQHCSTSVNLCMSSAPSRAPGREPQLQCLLYITRGFCLYLIEIESW